jgi:hypothetical protein
MFSTMPRRQKMPNPSLKVGDLVTVSDNRLDSGKSIGVITNIQMSDWQIMTYKVFCQGRALSVLRSQVWKPNEER